MKKLTQLTLPIAFIFAALNVNANEYSSKDYCFDSGLTAAAALATKADGKEVNFSDIRHNMSNHSNKITSLDLKNHADKFSAAVISTIEEQGRSELSQLYSRYNRDYGQMAQYFTSLCNASFSQLSVDHSSNSHNQKSLDEVQQMSEEVVKSMNSYPGCDGYKKMIIDNAYSDMPEYVRLRKLEIFYEKAQQLRCI